MGILLTFIACLSLLILAIPALIVGTIVSLFKHTGDRYFKNIALGIDHLGNVICQHLFNLVLIKKNSNNLFGNIRESVSGVLGLNFICGTCTKFGLFWCKFLNIVQKKHIEMAAENDKK